MKLSLIALSVIAVVIGMGVFASPAAASTTYTFVDLNPPGWNQPSSGQPVNPNMERANGASGGLQIGQGALTRNDEVANKVQALVWSGSASSYVSLQPASGYTGTWAYSVSNGVIGGQALNSTTSAYNAVIWTQTGSTWTMTNLQPASGYTSTTIRAVAGGYEVGTGTNGFGQGSSHALLWTGSNNVPTDLTPVAGYSAAAYGAYGNYQVGYANGLGGDTNSHAVIWNGSSTVVADLNTGTGATNSTAWSMYGDDVVGQAYTTMSGQGTSKFTQPVFWSGPNHTFINLNPTQLNSGNPGDAGAVVWYGTGNGAGDGIQVGSMTKRTATPGVGSGYSYETHAGLWTGTADSFVDLNQYLPAGWIAAEAYGVDPAGNIVGRAEDASYTYHAVMWDVPEPATMSLMGVGLLALLKRRKK